MKCTPHMSSIASLKHPLCTSGMKSMTALMRARTEYKSNKTEAFAHGNISPSEFDIRNLTQLVSTGPAEGNSISSLLPFTKLPIPTCCQSLSYYPFHSSRVDCPADQPRRHSL